MRRHVSRRRSTVREQPRDFHLGVGFGACAAEHLQRPIILSPLTVQVTQPIQRLAVSPIEGQCLGENRFGVVVLALQDVRPPQIAQHGRIGRISLQRRLIVVFGHAKVLLHVGNDGQPMMGRRMVRLFLQHHPVVGFRLIETALLELAVSVGQVVVDPLGIGPTGIARVALHKLHAGIEIG